MRLNRLLTIGLTCQDVCDAKVDVLLRSSVLEPVVQKFVYICSIVQTFFEEEPVQKPAAPEFVRLDFGELQPKVSCNH